MISAPMLAVTTRIDSENVEGFMWDLVDYWPRRTIVVLYPHWISKNKSNPKHYYTHVVYLDGYYGDDRNLGENTLFRTEEVLT